MNEHFINHFSLVVKDYIKISVLLIRNKLANPDARFLKSLLIR